jgi:hypothetical protein
VNNKYTVDKPRNTGTEASSGRHEALGVSDWLAAAKLLAYLVPKNE